MNSVFRFFAYVSLSALFWYLGSTFAIVALTYSIGLCITGVKHALRWTAYFIVLSTALASLAFLTHQFEQILPPLFAGLLLFGLAPLTPALYLIAANQIKNQSR